MIHTTFNHKATTGLSLVELMVAITISSVLLLGVSSVYLGSRHSNAVQDEFARLQENGRFAIHSLVKEVRQAGYQGCSNLKYISPTNIVAGGATFDFTNETMIVGHNDCNGGTCSPATPVAMPQISNATDAITVRRASSCSGALAGNLGVENANIAITDNACGFDQNDVLFITDCEKGDIFRVTNNPNQNGPAAIAHANGTNTTNRLSKVYDETARVMKFEQLTYYISTSTNPGTNLAFPNRSLYVDRFAVEAGNDTIVTTELVENVDDMEIWYGVDTNNDNSIDAFMDATQVQAAAVWPGVMSVRIHLQTTTRDNVANQNNNANSTRFTFMGIQQNSNDRRYRREFNSTINLRNRTL